MSMKRYGLTAAIGLLALIGTDIGYGQRAGAIDFTPPSGSGAPSQSTGGASRGSSFTPPSGQGAPSRGTSGASRGSLFTPPSGQGAPRQGTSGASRGTLFQPDPSRGAPQRTSGGASRGDLFTPAAGQGAPTQTTGGSSRVGSLPLDTIDPAPSALLALLPQSFSGTTLSAQPTFLVYLPASAAKTALFSLKDEAGNLVSQVTLPISGEAGVLVVKLPAPSLKSGKDYHWFLALKIDGNLSPSTPYVDGWIRRIQPSAELAAALKQPNELKRAEALGKNGVWYDCVATLATLRVQQPDRPTLQQNWSELLTSVGLQDIKQAPMLSLAKAP